MQVCSDVNVITFVSAYYWCALSKTTQTKCVFLIFDVYDRTGIINCMIQHSFIIIDLWDVIPYVLKVMG